MRIVHVIAVSGLVTALGNQGFQYLRLWIEGRRADRQAQYDHTILKANLDGAREHIRVLEAERQKDLERILFLEKLVEHNHKRISAVEDSQVNLPAVKP